ncbi:unnamed protein product, partial [Musa hybrid cultivar]
FSSPSAKQSLRLPGISLFLFLFLLRRCSPPFPDPSSLPLPLPLASLMQSLLGETLFELVYIFSSIEPNENTDSLNTRPLPTRTMDTAGTRALNPATTTAFPRRSAVFLPIGEQRKQRRCLHPPSSCRCGVFLGERRLPRLPLHRRNSVSAPPVSLSFFSSSFAVAFPPSPIPPLSPSLFHCRSSAPS